MSAPRLKWIHFLTAGFDRGVAMGLPDGVRVSFSAGVKAPMVAEHAVALLLALVRALPQINDEQRAHRWRREQISANIATLEEATVSILGLGHVGRDIAKKLAPFGAKTIAVSRLGTHAEHVAGIFPREKLCEALSLSDAVVICTSAEEKVLPLVGAREIAALKPGALLVNVARGSLVDEAALIAALERGHLGGAGLDVQAQEPLAADSPLWDMANVIISPHSAGAGSNGYVAHRALFEKNRARFLVGATLENQYR
jgi:phosphoglycerate dehydrogenase-like enzyme